MNCKPGQMATIVRGSTFDPCVSKRIGCPVTVVRLYVPRTLMGMLVEVAEGPSWEIEHPLSCPCAEPCASGLGVIPDSCLRPFDEDSKPESEAPHVERPITTA